MPGRRDTGTMPGQYNRQRRRDSSDTVLSQTVVQWAIITLQPSRDDGAACWCIKSLFSS